LVTAPNNLTPTGTGSSLGDDEEVDGALMETFDARACWKNGVDADDEVDE